MERHFHCTACGKCCKGWLPLSLHDALANAGRFPLAMILTTVRQSARVFDLTASLGTTMAFGKRKRVAVLITPTSYMPPSMDCPSLAGDGRCQIHHHKPARCKTMPFSPVRGEQDQAGLLKPRDGWECDVTGDAAVVYRDKVIVERADFDHERRQLQDQAVILRDYADRLIAGAPNVAAGLAIAANKARGGTVVLNFTTLLPRLAGVDQ
ncbi:MAG TPA: YkgJ family cysteine cluster protein, partial [Rhodospirillales bacterium]|nr:YkgJ family cysteine cluster protein [Rhodospirillales bacterium]